MFFIYLLQNKTNNKVYVGFTKNLKQRWCEHFSYAKKPNIYRKHNKFHYIHNSIHKYGKANFSTFEIENFQNEIDALEAEKFWIQFFRSWDKNFGYNLTMGGEGTFGRKHSKIEKEKISKKLLGNQNAKGTIHTENWKQDMSIKHAGEKNAKARLTAQEVLEIRKIHSENNIANIFKYLSDKYGLSVSGLEKIIYRKTWKHI